MNTSNTNNAKSIPFVLCFGLITCVLYGFGAGLRGDVGILLPSLADSTGLAYQDVSFCIAVMNLVFGATQPAFGMLAARKSNRFVLLIGVGIMAVSLVGMAYAHSFVALFISLGLLFGTGAGALAFGLILSSAMRCVGPERAMLISGMLNAAAGLGSFVLSPTLQSLLDIGGLSSTVFLLLVPTALLVPIIFVVTASDPKKLSAKPAGEVADDEHISVEGAPCEDVSGEDVTDESISVDDAHSGSKGLFRRAFRDRTFLLLVVGFFDLRIPHGKH